MVKIMFSVYGDYFYGNEVSEYGKKHGYVDYRTFAKAFDAVLANNLIADTDGIAGYWEPVNSGEVYEDAEGYTYTAADAAEKVEELEERKTELEELEEPTEAELEELQQIEENLEALEESTYPDVYQWFIVDARGAELCEEAGEVLYYNDTLDLYLWGVTHYGTAWDYVLTNIRCNAAADENK